jgi:O-succinylbenzoate synthase
MKIVQCRVYRYTLPYFNPIHKGSNARTGLLLQITDADGVSGWGEIAPLPGFSHETLVQATNEVLEFKKNTDLKPTLPSVKCGVELAWEDLEARKSGRLPFEWFSDDPNPTLAFPVTKLITGDDAAALKSALSAARTGFTTLKIKVGQLPLIQAIDRVWQIREAVGPSMKIRLDANRAWDMNQATRFANGVAACKVDFIEEPLEKSLEQGRAFYELTGMPIALDETLYLNPVITAVLDQARTPWVKAFVLKPSILGGFKICTEISRAAKSRGIETVLSSSYESGIMTQAIARYARTLSEVSSLGLDPYENLADDVISPRLKVINGKLNLTSIPYPPKIKTGMIEEI